jgi:acyl-CoA thioester hydrolase
MIAVEDLAPLPVYLRYTLVEADLDANGHLNVRRYMGLFDDANWGLYAAVGMTQDYFRNSGSGAFALEMHLHYYAEIRLGETVTVRTRLLAHSAKRIHYISFMLTPAAGMGSATVWRPSRLKAS